MAMATAHNNAGAISRSNPLDVAPRPFRPTTGKAASLSVTTTSSAAQAVGTGESVLFSNPGGAAVGIAFGDADVVAIAAEAIDVLPGQSLLLAVPSGCTHFAALASAGTGSLKFTRGI